MRRALLKFLLEWKNRPQRKPVLLDGARQTGKTYLLKELLGSEFPNVTRLDFMENPSLASAFEDSLDPKVVIANIELLTNRKIQPDTDLIIFDEIGECPRALTSLKYFAEQAPTYFVAASGSNIGLLSSFPVGKVEQFNLRPLSFEEFLWASEEEAIIQAFETRNTSAVAHGRLFDKLTDYYFTGGMPEAVAAWFADKSASTLEKVTRVNQIHRNLVEGYKRDFGKYGNKGAAHLIEAVFTQIPSQLSAVHDGSVNRFKFKDIYTNKARYSDFESAISWLHHYRLILKNYPIEGIPKAPLAAYQRENRVKLFMFDTGLLNHMLGSSYLDIKNQAYEYKGYVAENFVQQELATLNIEPSFSWSDARAEIEFVTANDNAQVIPIEVKSGTRTRAKSLQSYREKCQPHKTIKFTGTQASPPSETKDLVMPLYFVKYLREVWE